ncbi:hypothetical protein [Psychroserpens damuponensis]|uniref:hypothetical protein n=1 Tax=Psychroserpens damuponensis TaxID=943936 RepID=UPI00058E5200|nr:hypothetical protein [Psychroserpens damuponensis]
MIQHHVIKLLFLIFICCACNTSKQNISSDSYTIIETQVKRSFALYEKETELNFDKNSYLDAYINQIDTDNFKKSALRNKLGDSLFKMIFNNNGIKYLKNIENQEDIDVSKLSFNDKIKLVTKTKVENEDLSFLNNSKIIISLSLPRFTSNNKYCFIAFSHGQKGAMQGGVNLYVRDNEDWKFYKTVDSWIE